MQETLKKIQEIILNKPSKDYGYKGFNINVIVNENLVISSYVDYIDIDYDSDIIAFRNELTLFSIALPPTNITYVTKDKIFTINLIY